MINFIKEIEEINTNLVVMGEILIDNILVQASFNVLPSSYEFQSYQSHLVIFCHHLIDLLTSCCTKDNIKVIKHVI
jgi:hypothetical protein